MKNSELRIIARYGLAKVIYAGVAALNGNGCSTVGFELGVRWNTASVLMDIGRKLPITRR